MNALKRLRKEKGVTQQEVADYLGVNRVSYTDYENEKNKISPERLSKLADYFNVSVDEILGRGSSAPVPKRTTAPMPASSGAGTQRKGIAMKYYIRFECDGDNIFFNLFDKEDARSDDFLNDFQCSSWPWSKTYLSKVLVDFDDLLTFGGNQPERLLHNLSSWYEMACACWLEAMNSRISPLEYFDKFLAEKGLPPADEYVMEYTEEDIAAMAEHYHKCFAQVLAESES